MVIGLETGLKSISIAEFTDNYKNTWKRRSQIALVLGNEVDGIDTDTISKLDALVEIPMKQKKSLNVSVASGIAMYILHGTDELEIRNSK